MESHKRANAKDDKTKNEKRKIECYPVGLGNVSICPDNRNGKCMKWGKDCNNVQFSVKQEDLATAVIRDFWLNQILDWLITGKVNLESYSEEVLIQWITMDPNAKVIPERNNILYMFAVGASHKDIENYIVKALNNEI